MNEVDTNLSVDRTPELIAIEINSIKEQTRKMVLFNSIEIGRRLTEAKTMLEHGQWGEWLEKSVDYSQRTASNLMRIFDEYGSSQITLFCDNAKSQALANLSYTQAVALLGIPQDEREVFIQEHDIDSMSTRELQQAIKDKQELEVKLKEAETAKTVAESDRDKAKKEAESERQAWQRVSDSYKRLEETNKKHYETAERLKKELEEAQASGNTDEVERLEESLKMADSELNASLKKIEELELQLKETPIEVTAAPVIEKVPEEVERELNELRERTKELEAKEPQPGNTATIRFSVYFDTLVKGFRDLLGALAEIKDVDPAAHEKYEKAVKGLIDKMSERL